MLIKTNQNHILSHDYRMGGHNNYLETELVSQINNITLQ